MIVIMIAMIGTHHRLARCDQRIPQIHDVRRAHERVARARVRVAQREVAAYGLVAPINLGTAVHQHAQAPDAVKWSDVEGENSVEK